MMKHESIYLSVPKGGLLGEFDEIAKSDDWNYWATDFYVHRYKDVQLTAS